MNANVGAHTHTHTHTHTMMTPQKEIMMQIHPNGQNIIRLNLKEVDQQFCAALYKAGTEIS